MINDSLYLSVQEDITFHITPTNGFILIPKKGVLRFYEDTEMTGKELTTHDLLTADRFLIDFLVLLNGVDNLSTVSEKYKEKYGPIFGRSFLKQIYAWLQAQQPIIRYSNVPAEEPRYAPCSGNENAFYPLHATFEIIETCNFSCDHCYYSSSPDKKGRISLEDAIVIMDKLKANGVKIIELTGGECTIHPNFPEILDYASKNFNMVAIITNGYQIGKSERIAEAVYSKGNVVVQVSIDGIEETHDIFRKHTNAFKEAVKAVKVLREHGIIIRIGSSINAANQHQVLDLFKLGKSLGVQRHAFSPVAPIGRGCNVTSSPGVQTQQLYDKINHALAPFADDPILNSQADIPEMADTSDRPKNCGAGWRTFAIDYNGYVRACNYSRDSKKFGNMIFDPYDVIFGQKANYLFNNAPSPGGQECQGCAYYAHCAGCFVKAFMISETEYPACAWRKKWFPDMPLSLSEDRFEKKTAAEHFAAVPDDSEVDLSFTCSSGKKCTCHH